MESHLTFHLYPVLLHITIAHNSQEYFQGLTDLIHYENLIRILKVLTGYECMNNQRSIRRLQHILNLKQCKYQASIISIKRSYAHDYTDLRFLAFRPKSVGHYIPKQVTESYGYNFVHG